MAWTLVKGDRGQCSLAINLAEVTYMESETMIDDRKYTEIQFTNGRSLTTSWTIDEIFRGLAEIASNKASTGLTLPTNRS